MAEPPHRGIRPAAAERRSARERSPIRLQGLPTWGHDSLGAVAVNAKRSSAPCRWLSASAYSNAPRAGFEKSTAARMRENRFTMLPPNPGRESGCFYLSWRQEGHHRACSHIGQQVDYFQLVSKPAWTGERLAPLRAPFNLKCGSQLEIASGASFAGDISRGTESCRTSKEFRPRRSTARLMAA